MSGLEFRRINAKDSKCVLEIERQTSLSEWSFDGYKTEISRTDSICLVAELKKTIVGFVIARLISAASEGEILNFGVASDFQKMGIGTLLLREVIEIILLNKIEYLWLEVRKSNLKAKKFYEKNGFEIVGARKNFYNNPTEDALLMKLRL